MAEGERKVDALETAHATAMQATRGQRGYVYADLAIEAEGAQRRFYRV